MAVGLVLIGIATDRALVRPLVQLRHAVVDLRETRELSTSLPLERRDELGELAVEVAAFSTDLREAEHHRREHQIAREKAEIALRENEEHMRQSQRMEGIGQLAGGIAHDFNNLLTTILGYCELLSARKGKAAERQIEQIAKAGRRAASLTSQLLAFSRKQVLQPRVIDLNAVIAEMRGLLERLISEDVTLVIDLASDLKPVKADPGQIEQVIMNLVVNARDAMPRGGRLKIATRSVDVDGENALPSSVQTSAEIAVSDTGDGMDAETLQKIFDPFFTTKAPGAGTGLGLSTVYGIVTQSGGGIVASSQPLAGSTFRVRLPQIFDPFFTTKAPGAGTGLGLSTVYGIVTQSGGGALAARGTYRRGAFRRGGGRDADFGRARDDLARGRRRRGARASPCFPFRSLSHHKQRTEIRGLSLR